MRINKSDNSRYQVRQYLKSVGFNNRVIDFIIFKSRSSVLGDMTFSEFVKRQDLTGWREIMGMLRRIYS